MKPRFRIIPILLLDNNKLVKTIRFKSPRYIGDPLNTAKIFNDKEVDELIILDRSADKNGINFDLVKSVASECFIPLAYGGGIKHLSDVDRLVNSGVEKVILRSALFKNLNLLKEIVGKYGNQAVISCFDLKHNIFKELTFLGSKIKNNKIPEKIISIIRIGVGEIMLQAVDLEGTMQGVDEKILKIISKITEVPTIYTGGIGSLEDALIVAKHGVSAAAAGSLFVYQGPRKGILINYPTSEELGVFYAKIDR